MEVYGSDDCLFQLVDFEIQNVDFPQTLNQQSMIRNSCNHMGVKGDGGYASGGWVCRSLRLKGGARGWLADDLRVDPVFLNGTREESEEWTMLDEMI